MPTPSFASLGSREPTNAEIADYLARQRRDMQYLLTNLDDLNISRLNARVIIAGSITTDKLAAAVITTDKLAAGAVTADKISVAELSAITANMGKITSGEIYGAYIATAEDTFPRIEFSSSGILLGAYSNADSYVAMSPSEGGSPAHLIYETGVLKFLLQHISGTVALLATTGIQINAAGGDLFLNADDDISVPSWLSFVNRASGNSLQDDLNDKLEGTGVTDTFTSQDGKNVTVIDGLIFGIT